MEEHKLKKLNSTMRKLQKAIVSTGLVVKIGQCQFYSEEQKRMITIYILSTPVLQLGRKGWKTKDYEIIRTASMVDLIWVLKDIWDYARVWDSVNGG